MASSRFKLKTTTFFILVDTIMMPINYVTPKQRGAGIVKPDKKIKFMAAITLGGSPCHTNGDLPKKGEKLANFHFVRNDMTELELDSLRGKNVIMNIFPSVDTRVCATSVRTFNQRASELSNTAVLCISRDLPFAQARFCGAEGIEEVITVSDFRSEEFAEKLGIRITDGAFAGLDARSIVVLDPGGRVIHTELVKEIGDEPDYDSAIGAIRND